jgi:hypothetical protein
MLTRSCSTTPGHPYQIALVLCSKLRAVQLKCIKTGCLFHVRCVACTSQHDEVALGRVVDICSEFKLQYRFERLLKQFIWYFRIVQTRLARSGWWKGAL